MSKHWQPPRIDRRLGQWHLSWGEVRLMVFGGMFLGLAYAFTPAPDVAAAPDLDFPTGGSVTVIDGDTFDYDGERIRIADIDTPEVDGRCAYESQLAARATDRMSELLNAGPFELEPVDRDEDQYGRKLRIVTRGGRSLGDQLVAEGLARTWTGRREPWC